MQQSAVPGKNPKDKRDKSIDKLKLNFYFNPSGIMNHAHEEKLSQTQLNHIIT